MIPKTIYSVTYMTYVMKQRSDIERMFTDLIGGGGFVRGFQVTIGPDGIPRGYFFTNDGRKEYSQSGVDREVPIEVINDEKNNTIRAVAEIPGVEKENIDISVKEGQVTVSADRDGKKYSGTVDLDSNINAETAKATYTNGILEIVFDVTDAVNQTKIKIQ